MRLSDAIQLGAMITSQAFRTLFKEDGACALGAALRAVGVSPEEARCAVRKQWPWAFAVSVNCPSCGRSRLVCQVIVHLNDDHRWTREKIGAWVAGIEPSQPPDDAPGGARSEDAPTRSCDELAAQLTIPIGLNLKTATTLGLTIPPSLLLRADQVLE